jgi:hypothetical protein
MSASGQTLSGFVRVDPRRTGVLLIGGDKTGNARWYEEFVPRADAIYAQHLKEIDEDNDSCTTNDP